MVGAAPSFSDVHLLRALFSLKERKTGRKRLVSLLGVGEGSVRTILKRLDERGYIESTRGGHTLSARGSRRVRQVLGKLSEPRVFEAEDLVGLGAACLVVVYGAVDRVSTGVRERDVALRAGAEGALAFVCRDGRVGFPDGSPCVLPETVAVLEGLELREGDVAVIGFAASQEKAEDGALAVALSLTDLKL